VTIVVSHDVIPDKLMDDPQSPAQNTLFRRFLSTRHIIIWMGDELGWYVAVGKEKRSPPQPQSIQNSTGMTKPTRLDQRLTLVEPTIEDLLFNMKPWKDIRPRPIASQDDFYNDPPP